MACPGSDVLEAYSAGSLDVAEHRRIRTHVDRCRRCRDALSDESNTQVTKNEGSAAAREVARGVVPRGTTLGRYLILDPLGEGGMGLVYAAFDAELDRKVAIKILRSDLEDRAGSTDWRARLSREAQAMARLSHPNVIPVYDVGSYENRLFMAMELVDGGTLKSWLRARRRRWDEILEPFISAGRGLAAAHRAGLVHRDFKPDNVLMGLDERPRVTDFGLVRAADPNASEPTPPTVRDRAALTSSETTSETVSPPAQPLSTESPESPSSPGSSGSWENQITRHGTVMGTPGYMSPEQSQAKPIDARSDQFSFCASLYEALYGERPFGGASFAEMIEALEKGELRAPPENSDVPAWVRRVVLRGLARSPEARWPSMDALLAALERDPRRARRRWAAAGAVVASLLGVGLLVHQQTRARVQLCKGAERKVAGIWDDAERERMQRAFSASGKIYAAHAWQEVQRTLDAYVSSWTAMHTDACEATRLRGEQSEQVMSLRMACLEDRREDLEALTSLFKKADAEIVEGSVQAARELKAVRGCGDIGALTTAVSPPPDLATRTHVESVRAKLADARALLRAGKYKDGLVMSKAAVADAQATHYRPVEAEAFELDGRLRHKAADYPGASDSFKSAVWAAEESRLDDVKTASALRLAVVSVDLSGFPAAHDWLRYAEAASRRLSAVGDLKIDVLIASSELWFRESKYNESERSAREAVREAERTLAPDHLRLAEAHRALGDTLKYEGKAQEAYSELERARAIFAQVLGAEHPEVGVIYRKEADIYGLSRDGKRALELGQKALAIFERAMPPDHLLIAQTRTNLAEALGLLGRYEEALAEEGRALPTYERVFGKESENVGVSSVNIGYALSQLGRYDEARARLLHAIEIYDKTLGGDSPDKAEPLLRLGELELKQHRPLKALAYLERALPLRAKDSDPCELLAPIELALGRALWDAGGDHVRATTLATRARDQLAACGKPSESAEATAWLEKHAERR